MKLSTEQIEKIKSFNSVEELIKEVPDIDSDIIKSLYESYNSSDLSDEELENVTGGTCFSSGVKDPNNGETKQFAIVSPLNTCPFNGMTDWHRDCFCHECSDAFTVGATWYCRVRWKGHNTVYKGPSPDVIGLEALYFIDDPQ